MQRGAIARDQILFLYESRQLKIGQADRMYTLKEISLVSLESCTKAKAESLCMARSNALLGAFNLQLQFQSRLVQNE